MMRNVFLPGVSRGMAVLLVPAFAVMLGGAAPQRGIALDVPAAPSNTLPAPPRAARPAPRPAFQPAPLPNRDIDGPVGPRASNAPSLSPSLFTRSDTYRGEGFSSGSSATAEQERRVRPGAGFNWKMPFAPN